MKNQAKFKTTNTKRVSLTPHPIAEPIYQHFLNINFQLKNFSHLPKGTLESWLSNEVIDVIQDKESFLFFSNFRAVSIAYTHSNIPVNLRINANVHQERIKQMITASFTDALISTLNLKVGPELFYKSCHKHEVNELFQKQFGKNPIVRPLLCKIFGMTKEEFRVHGKRLKKQSAFKPLKQTSLEF